MERRRTGIRGFAAALGRAFRTWKESRRQVRELLAKNDRLLADLGLDRNAVRALLRELRFRSILRQELEKESGPREEREPERCDCPSSPVSCPCSGRSFR